MIANRVPKRIPRVAWSLLDQATVSAGNFLLNITLARTLAPRVYGGFTVLYLILLSLNVCQSSVVNYWQSIRGATAASGESERLQASALAATAVWSVLFSVVLFFGAWATHLPGLWFPASIAMVCWQLQETARRGLLSQLRYEACVFPDAFSYLGQVALIAILRPANLSTVFLMIAATSVVSLFWQTWLLGIGRIRKDDLANYLRESFWASRFLLSANGLNMLVIQVPVWSLLGAAGKTSVAIYQCLINLQSVINPILFGLNNHLVPAIARALSKGRDAAQRLAIREGGFAGVLVLTYVAVVLAAPELVLTAAYGHSSQYLAFTNLLRWLMLGCVFYYLGTVFSAYEAGVGRTSSYMYSQIAGLVFVCAAGIPFIAHNGTQGAVLVSIGALFVRTTALVAISILRDRKTMSDFGAVSEGATRGSE